MPWVEENGLLPGRGAPGRALPPGRPTGRGDGAASVAEAAAAGAWGSSAGSSFAAGRGPGRGPGAEILGSSAAGTSTGAAGASVSAGAVGDSGAAGASSVGAAGCSGAFRAAFLASAASFLASSSAPYLSWNFFSTGGSTVELGAFTNSPRSFSIFRTSLLGTPYVLASSWTRTLATLFLQVRATEVGLRTASWCARSSRSSHRRLMSSCSSSFSVGQCRSRKLFDVLPERLRAQPGRDPEGPRKGMFAFGECEAVGRGMQVRPTAGGGATRIGYDGRAVRILSRDDPQQLTLGGPLPTCHAHPHRTRRGRSRRIRSRSIRAGTRVTAGQSFHHR